MVIVYIDKLSAGQQAICDECSAKGRDFRSQIWIPYCRLAALENRLSKKPTYGQATEEGIDATGIPENCANQYIGLGRREIR